MTIFLCLRKAPCLYQSLHCFRKLHQRHSDRSAQDITNPATQLIQQLEKNKVENINFKYDNHKRVIVYTDGCCYNNNTKDETKRRSGIGVYWGDQDHPLNLSVPIYDTVLTSNRAELMAAHAAVLIAVQMKLPLLCLRLDSMYVKNGCERWLHRWKANSWLTTNGAQVKNQDLWKSFMKDLAKVRVKFEKVNDGSSDGQKNAHELANKGASIIGNSKAL